MSFSLFLRAMILGIALRLFLCAILLNDKYKHFG